MLGWTIPLKGSYDAFLKIIILCIWWNRICWHTLMFKKHIIFQILYITVNIPLCPASLKRFVFYKVPPSDKHSLLWLANWHSALWLAEHHKPRRKFNTPFHNHELQLSKLKTVNNVLSFTISSSREWKRVAWQTQWWNLCVFANKLRLLTGYTLCCDVTLSLSLSFSLSVSLTHTRRTKLYIWAVNSKYLN